jgi:hypothetical protein
LSELVRRRGALPMSATNKSVGERLPLMSSATRRSSRDKRAAVTLVSLPASSGTGCIVAASSSRSSVRASLLTATVRYLPLLDTPAPCTSQSTLSTSLVSPDRSE